MHPDFFIRCDGKYIRIDTREIRYIEARKNYVRIVTAVKVYLALISLRQLEEALPQQAFCRVHRSYIVALSHVQSFDSEAVYLGDRIIPITSVYRRALQAKVRVLVSDTRTRVAGEPS